MNKKVFALWDRGHSGHMMSIFVFLYMFLNVFIEHTDGGERKHTAFESILVIMV